MVVAASCPGYTMTSSGCARILLQRLGASSPCSPCSKIGPAKSARRKTGVSPENTPAGTVQAYRTLGMTRRLDDRERARSERYLVAIMQQPVDMRRPVTTVEVMASWLVAPSTRCGTADIA